MKNALTLPLLAAVLLTCAIFYSCASNDEKAVRRENAFNVAGTWTTCGTLSEIPMTITIENEKGRHNVVLTITRSGSLTAKEKSFYEQLGIDIARLPKSLTETIVIGQGRQYSLDGGENISDDFGKTSRIEAYSDDYAYDGSTKIRHFIRAEITKSSFILKGELVIEVTETGSYSELPITFEATNGSAFYTQYFGGWSGKVTMDEQTPSNIIELRGLMITKTDDASFNIAPSLTKLSRDGREFTFDPKLSAFKISQLADYTIPAILLNFDGAPNEHISLYGHIFSLGNLSGAIVYRSNEAPDGVIIGSFEFVKD